MAANCCRTLLFGTTRLASSLHQFPPLLSRRPPLDFNTRLYSSRRNVVEILEERGLLDSVTTDALRRSDSPPLRVYCGFDPTADSLHLGNLLASWFIRCGHHAVALVGGATGRVGDPSGKSLERPELNQFRLSSHLQQLHSRLSCREKKREKRKRKKKKRERERRAASFPFKLQRQEEREEEEEEERERGERAKFRK